MYVPQHGDNPQQLASVFCSAYGLDAGSAVAILEAVVLHSMQNNGIRVSPGYQATIDSALPH
jgi:hypothetical protein